MCVGLYAKWGSGKSFMIHLIKKNLDPQAQEDGRTHALSQWFHEPPRQAGAANDDGIASAEPSSWRQFFGGSIAVVYN
eukprot:5503386-Prymnesium_polylepis.1